MDVVRATCDIMGVTICCEGWSGGVGCSIVVLIACGGDAPALFDVIDAQIGKKDVSWIAVHLIKGVKTAGSNLHGQRCSKYGRCNRG